MMKKEFKVRVGMRQALSHSSDSRPSSSKGSDKENLCLKK